jgi:hypothetical protein
VRDQWRPAADAFTAVDAIFAAGDFTTLFSESRSFRPGRRFVMVRAMSS